MWNLKNRGALCTCWLSSLALLGCGEVADPDVVTRNDLKAPSALNIVDLGNGSVQLRWTTANFEDDFEGYNVYGAVLEASTLTELGVTVGEPIQLLDNDGEPIEAAKSILSAFTYESKNEYALPGTADNAEAEYNTAGQKFSTLPFHKLRTANKEANLPTCKPLTAGVCQALGNEKEETAASEITSIGSVSYDLPQVLEVGKQACFFVFAVQDEGEEISQSSTNVACIVPKYKTTPDSVTLAASQQQAPTNLHTFREGCALDETTLEPTCTAMANTANQGTLSATTTDRTIQFEKYSSGDVSLVSGKNAVILSLGYFAEGFADPNFINLVQQAPVLTNYSADNLSQDGGYSQPGQSISLQANHIYVIANAMTDISPTAEDFYYDWLFADTVDCDTSCTVSYEMLISKNPAIPNR